MPAVEQRRALEKPTFLLIFAVYGAFALVTFYWAALPLWLVFAAGAAITALHGSVQHEAIHGHPTRSSLVNELLVSPPLMLWVPYRRYRAQHLRHHRNDRLTDPFDDPESFYMPEARWRALPAPVKALHRLNNTLFGRLILGPAMSAVRFFLSEGWRMARGERRVVAGWALHVPALAVLLVWVIGVCQMPLWLYIACFAYPGTALILMRSFAEHRAHPDVAARTAVVEANPALALLFLNNNLHAAHHESPNLAWYDLPAYYRRHRERLLRDNGNYHIPGYAALARRYLWRIKEPVAHPGFGDDSTS